MSSYLKVNKKSYKEIEDILLYSFNNKSILQLALTHSSIKRNPDNYERLEFLGDSIIGFVISDWLFLNKQDQNEGDLSKTKSMLVSRKKMALISKEMGLINYAIINKSVNLNFESTRNRINSDLYESIIAAIYLDSDYEMAKHFIYRTLLDFESIGNDDNYKGALNEFCHKIKID